MQFKEVNLVQGDIEWKKWRNGLITATDTAKILGFSKYGTAKSVYDEKVLGKEIYVSPAMRRGTELEPKAREFLSNKYHMEFKPRCVESIDYPFMGASMDAVASNNKKGYEIKCPGEENMEKAIKGILTEDHIWQCQKQMLIMGWESMILFYYYNDFLNVEHYVHRDEKKIEKILKEEPLFYYNHLKPKIPPDDDVEKESSFEINEVAKRWRECYTMEKAAALEKKALEVELKRLVDGKSCIFTIADVKHIVVERAGVIDYKKLLHDKKIKEEEIEKYRKNNSSYSLFSILKN